jgi:hypothetical protein
MGYPFHVLAGSNGVQAMKSTETTRSPKASRNQSTQIAGAMSRRNLLLGGSTLAAVSTMSAGATTRVAQAQQPPVSPPGRQLPNILVIFGDDIGIANVSTYSNGLMGYETPNIDRIALDGSCLRHFVQVFENESEWCATAQLVPK